jgi:hypothetical protein
MHCGAEVTESSTNKQHHLSTIILQWFMQQDNNIVKICVENQDEDISVT